jgi:hypothetical protein
MIGAFGSQPVGGREPPIRVLHVRLGRDRGHLVRNRIRLRGGHRLPDRCCVQSIHHDTRRTQLLELAQLRPACRRCGHFMAPSHQLRHESSSQYPSAPSHEYVHDVPLSSLPGCRRSQRAQRAKWLMLRHLNARSITTAPGPPHRRSRPLARRHRAWPDGPGLRLPARRAGTRCDCCCRWPRIPVQRR